MLNSGLRKETGHPIVQYYNLFYFRSNYNDYLLNEFHSCQGFHSFIIICVGNALGLKID